MTPQRMMRRGSCSGSVGIGPRDEGERMKGKPEMLADRCRVDQKAAHWL